MEAVKKKKAFGTFENEPALSLQKRILIGAEFQKMVDNKKLDLGIIALLAGVHKETVRRIKNVTKPYTQTVFNKLLFALNMTEKEFFL